MSDLCCGSAGIYNVVHDEMAAAILEKKMRYAQTVARTLSPPPIPAACSSYAPVSGGMEKPPSVSCTSSNCWTNPTQPNSRERRKFESGTSHCRIS